jgi:hypothetical protein
MGVDRRCEGTGLCLPSYIMTDRILKTPTIGCKPVLVTDDIDLPLVSLLSW